MLPMEQGENLDSYVFATGLIKNDALALHLYSHSVKPQVYSSCVYSLACRQRATHVPLGTSTRTVVL
jgi:hypothetical protein